jgi:glutamine synthetase
MFHRQWPCFFTGSSVGSPSFVAESGIWNDEQVAAAREIEAALKDIDLVRVAFCDPHGLTRSKTIPAQLFALVLRNGMDFSPGPFLCDTGQAVAVDFARGEADVGVGEITGAGDFVLVPDPLTFQVLPGTSPVTAWVLGDEFLRDGSPHPLASRRVLREVSEQFAARGLTPVVGLEVEWYLTRLTDRSPGNAGNGFGTQGPAPMVEAMNAGYQFNLDAFYDSIAPITDPLAMDLRSLGLPVRSMEHETGPGQVETTFSPMLAMDSADAMLLFRTLVKQTCRRRGYHASFMALPRIENFYPSGWHLHQSVIRTSTGENLFAPETTAEVISPAGKSYIDGLIDRAREFCILTIPTVNGYRRLAPEFSFSPTVIDWSFENRAMMIRALGDNNSTHIENRLGEPCANPYLAIASQLAAGLDGLTGEETRSAGRRKLDNGNSPRGLPRSLREALEAFRGSEHADSLLGSPLASCFAKLKESEVSRFEAWCAVNQPGHGVTEWEHREYFRVF